MLASRVHWADRRLRGGWIVLAIAFVIGCAFLPRTLVNEDEYYYSGQAAALARGHLIPRDGDPLPVHVGPRESAGAAAKYPIAWPLVLALPRTLSIRAMFVVALLVHLVGGAAVARMLVRRGLPAWLTIVWVLHPVAWLYGRTIMSDGPAVAMMLVAMDAWEEEDTAVAATAAALMVAMRMAGGVTLIGLAFAVHSDGWRRRREALAVLAAVGFAVLAQTAVSWISTGGQSGNSYFETGSSLLGGPLLLENALLYGAGLLLLPPFSLSWVLLRRRVDHWAVAAVPVVVFFVSYGYHDTSPHLLETLVGGQRFLLPAHAALLVATASAWGTVHGWRWSRVAVPGAALAAGIVVCVGTWRLSSRYEPAVRALEACGPGVIAYNFAAHRVAGSVSARSYRLVDGRDPWNLGDVVVLGVQYETNRPRATLWAPERAEVTPAGWECRRYGNYRIFATPGRCPATGIPCG